MREVDEDFEGNETTSVYPIYLKIKSASIEEADQRT